MILFFAPNPNNFVKKEGYLQRVLSIDRLFENIERKYIHDIDDTEEIFNALKKANTYYVHSVYEAEAITDLIEMFGSKFIVDLHGVVPEEELFNGNKANFNKYNEIEKLIFRKCNNFIAVSNQMVEHFKSKYPESVDKNWIVLPIFDRSNHNIDIKSKDNKQIIYAGGSQKWQNIDLMKDIVKKNINDYKYTILTQDSSAFIDLSNKKNVLVKYVEKQEVYKFYKKSIMGFVLRDDILINRVSCPTKLIEYMDYGVVPIVKYANIGDFKAMGYKYVKYEDFSLNRISVSRLHEYAKFNQELMIQYEKVSAEGMNLLKDTFQKVSKIKILKKNESIMAISKNLVLILNNKKLIKDNKEKDNAINSLRNELHLMHSSRIWRTRSLLIRILCIIYKRRR